MANTSPVGSHHHITPARYYVFNLLALLVLMTATVVCAKISFPGGTLTNNIIAMGIAVAKALLVITIFMGVAYTTKLAKIWAIIGFMWLFFLFGVMIDYKSRDADPQVKGFHDDAGSALREGRARELKETPGDDAWKVTPGGPKGE